jgi:uncharacterized protein (DUF1330 family)
MKYKSLLEKYANGQRSSTEIATLCGMSPKYVQKLLLRYNLPRLRVGGMIGEKNQFWHGGRTLEKGRYYLVKVPNHPHKNSHGYVREHRLVVEKHLGRYLKPKEVVDHINGNTLDNRIENLRVFPNNAEHLRTTLKGKIPKWTKEGFENMIKNGRRLQARLHEQNRS